jgi:hypothetical protein
LLTPKQKEEVNGNRKESSPEEKGGHEEGGKEGRPQEVRLLPLRKVSGWKGGGLGPATLPSHNQKSSSFSTLFLPFPVPLTSAENVIIIAFTLN